MPFDKIVHVAKTVTTYALYARPKLGADVRHGAVPAEAVRLHVFHKFADVVTWIEAHGDASQLYQVCKEERRPNGSVTSTHTHSYAHSVQSVGAKRAAAMMLDPRPRKVWHLVMYRPS